MYVRADRNESVIATRMRIRGQEYNGQTAGLAPGYVQGNLVVLPKAAADDFRSFCLRNPKPCPILAVSEPGDPKLPTLGNDVDTRTDLPRYRIWRQGELAEEVDDISSYWQADMVAFVLGCSFSFEQALLEDGIKLRHIEHGSTVPMFRTCIDTVGAGQFRGPLVVSMRPLNAKDAIRAIQITTRYPMAHGAPVHVGAPHLIGIRDVMVPDYGDPMSIEEDEIPVFWACGVTPQAVIARSRPPLSITGGVSALVEHACTGVYADHRYAGIADRTNVTAGSNAVDNRRVS